MRLGLAATVWMISATARAGTAFVGVDVVTEDGLLRDQTVRVEGERIVEVGPSDSVEVPPFSVVVDGAGRTLMPGLVDMHAHVPPAHNEAARRVLSVMLAQGITTARSMAGHPSHPGLRDAIARGDLLAPSLVLASPPLHGASAPTPEAAREAVRRAHAEGFDLVKLHHIEDASVWEAAVDEARALGMPTSGHLTQAVSLQRAVAAGQQVEHLDGFVRALLPEEAQAVPFGQFPPPGLLAQVDRARLPALAASVAHGHFTPTLGLFEKLLAPTPADALAARPEMRWISDAAKQAWTAQHDQSRPHFAPLAELADLRRDVTRALLDAGAPLLAGSDAPQAFHVMGFALHEELEALVQVGATPSQALAAATVNPARWLGRADLGVVAEGAVADLVLLGSDPTADVSATRAIQGVMLRGRWLDRAALDRLLDEALPPGPKPSSVVWLVRHAEAHNGVDPELTRRGHKRARALAEKLAHLPIERIFVTPTRRARATAAPLAAALGVRMEEYHPADPDLAALFTSAGAALVVGHSNTVHRMAAMLGASVEPFAEDEHDRIVRVEAGGRAAEHRLSDAPPLQLAPCALAGLAAPARCGVLSVPEDRSAPEGRRIDIHVVRVLSDRPQHPPLVVMPGGPGIGATTLAPHAQQLFGFLLADRDLLFVDQRGTGSSNPLTCPGSGDLEGAFATDAPRADAVAACRDALSERADLRHYTTRDAVEDLEAVRAALAIPKLDLFGLSYGTRPALDYARRYPDRAGAVVIRSPAPTEMRLPLHTPRDAQDALDGVVAACAADARCDAAFPELARDVERLVAQIRANPQQVALTDPQTGLPATVPVDAGGLGSAFFFLLYEAELYRHLPALVSAAADGDLSPLAQMLAPAMTGTWEAVASGLRWSVICNEDVPFVDGIDDATAGTFWGRQPVDSEIEACALWPRARVPRDYFEPVTIPHPVLVLSGTMDPVTPPRWGELLDATLPNALHVPLAGASHLPPFPGCTGEIVRAFLDGDGPVDTSCATSASFFPDFVVPG